MNQLIQIGPISPLRQRLIDDMTMRRFSRETKRNYLRDVGRFATWLGRSPHTASAEDVRQFQIEQQQAGVFDDEGPVRGLCIAASERAAHIRLILWLKVTKFC